MVFPKKVRQPVTNSFLNMPKNSQLFVDQCTFKEKNKPTIPQRDIDAIIEKCKSEVATRDSIKRMW